MDTNFRWEWTQKAGEHVVLSLWMNYESKITRISN